MAAEKPKPKSDDPKQSERFIEAAREVEADESKEGADRAFKKVAAPRQVAVKKDRRSQS